MNYSYDANNRQTFAERTDHTNQQTSVYDCAGQRVQTTANGTTRAMVYDIFGQNVVEYSNGSLERENIYRGGQLLAVSEPLIAAAAAPSELVAVPSGGGVSVTLSWSAAAGATNYRVARATSKDGPYQLVGTTSSTGFTDTGVSGGNAYLYKVCAADGQGNCASGYSNIAMSATVTFPTDPTITTFAENPANATPIKAAHITELRTAVNAVRHVAGMPDATWTHPTLTPGVSVISVDDVRDLRNKLDEALTALRIQTSAYTDQTLAGAPNGTLIKGAHIRELRQRATKGSGSCYKTITQFVADFYQGALGRQPNASELSQWTAMLTQAQGMGQLLGTAQSLGATLFTSAEYISLNTSNADYVTDLYEGYLHRPPDVLGYNNWLGTLNGGASRADVRAGFALSTEFQNNVGALCWAAGTSGGIKYVLSDLQGSTRAVMNNNGVGTSSVVARHDYLPFGEEISAGTGLRTAGQGYGAVDTNRWKYGLLERDGSTGLDHAWWRKYESFAGRWTSPDPYRGSMSVANPQSFNLYAYVGNDPVNFIDPTGLMTCFGYHVFIWHFDGDGNLTGVDYLGFLAVFCWEDEPIGGDPVGGGPGGGGREFNHPQKPKPTPKHNPTPLKPTPYEQRRKALTDCLTQASREYRAAWNAAGLNPSAHLVNYLNAYRPHLDDLVPLTLSGVGSWLFRESFGPVGTALGAAYGPAKRIGKLAIEQAKRLREVEGNLNKASADCIAKYGPL